MTKNIFDLELNGFFGAAEVEKTLFIPEDITTIGESAFSGNEYLEVLYIPASVKKIHKRAFANCINLKKVDFMSSDVYIEADAFDGCNNLTSLACEDRERNLCLKDYDCIPYACTETLAGTLYVELPEYVDCDDSDFKSDEQFMIESFMDYNSSSLYDSWESISPYFNYSFLGEIQLSELFCQKQSGKNKRVN